MPEERDLKERLRSLRIERDTAVPRRSPWPFAAAIGLAAAVLGFGAWLASRHLEPPRVVRVVHARVSEGGAAARNPVLSGAGYVITAEKYIAIGVRVPGRIERYLVDEGDSVAVGQPLVELDARDYRAGVGRAEAAVRLARANRELASSRLARVRKLFGEGVTSKEELDEAVGKFKVTDASLGQVQNELTQARVNLDDTVLRSSVDGVVLAKLKGVGEIAVPGGFAGAGDLLRIADLSELRAEIDVSEADLSQVSLGQPAEVVPDAYPDARYRAVVVKRKPQVNRQKGTLTVEVRIEDPDERLLPDMSARVTFLTGPRESPGNAPAVLVPRAAIHGNGQGRYVWLVVDGRVRRTPVDAGAPIGDEIVVERGLSGGEAVVIGPPDGLRDGAPVDGSGS